ncbi:hypothetical protein SASPL_134996 [Salvia splendens]|uniref:Uncharacterized protein n=1 Tax=Salvia splendens TaxID=180675 RepID=A0A8X8WZ94_SALSN|nr:hypothetical protein SASPL_134996 [Salvia splendens]
MSFHTVLSFLLLALLATCSVSLLNYDGFTIDMIHRDSLVSSMQNSKPSYRNLLNGALQRSKKRTDYLASGTPTADVLPSGGEFLVKLSVAILGNLAQVNFLVGFDLTRKLVSFKQTDCTIQ